MDLPDPVAADSMVLVDFDSAGVNYADTHHLQNVPLVARHT